MSLQKKSPDEHYLLLLNSAAEGIYEIDMLGNCVFSNKAALKMLGYEELKDVIGRNMHDLIHHMHEDGTAFPVKECKIFQAFIEGTDQHVVDEVLWTRDGRSFPAEYWSYPIFSEGKIIGSVVTFVDITDRRKSENELLNSQRRLKGVIEGTNVGTWEWNVKTGEIVFNERWAEIIGFSLEELSPVNINTWNDKIHPDDLIESGEQLCRLFAREIHYYDFEGRMKHKNGSWIWVHDRGKVIEWTSEDKPLIMAGTHIDITARKGIEMSLKESEARLNEMNATKDKFFSIIAHDLRSPFNAILGFCELLLIKAKSNDYSSIENYASIILNSSRNTLNLLTNLLDWSRSQRNKIVLNPEYFDMGSLINETFGIFHETANQKQISLVKILPLEAVVYADKQMIATVVRNLISNAIKYTNLSGEIIVSVKIKSKGVTVEVKDNGVGIKEEKISKLFRIDESFSTPGTKNEKGTGLGLLLCKEFVDKHGGLIQVKSEIGNGSTFSFTIPSLRLKANSPKSFELEAC